LYSCYFFYHVKYPFKIFDMISKKFTNTTLCVLGNASGDWLLHDGLFENYLLQVNEDLSLENYKRINKKIKFWKEFWAKLSVQRKYIRNLDAINNNFIHALMNKYHQFKINKISTQIISNKIKLDHGYLMKWIKNESTSIFEELKLSSKIIDDIMSSLQIDNIEMDFKNSLLLYSIETKQISNLKKDKNVISYFNPTTTLKNSSIDFIQFEQIG